MIEESSALLQENQISKEKRKDLYVYRDNSDPEKKVLFETVAEDILQADADYELETGNDPRMQPNVGCSIESMEEKETDSEGLKKLYRGIWADKLESGQMLPAGGSMFKKEMDTFLELDFDSFDDKLATLSPQRLQEVFEITGSDKIVEYLEKLNADIDPKMFFACLQVQKKIADILQIKEGEKGDSFERMKKYGGEVAPKISDLVGNTQCAERAALGQYILQKLGIQSSYMSGIVMEDADNVDEFPEEHSFIVLKGDDGKSYLFDIARPHNNDIPSIYLSDDVVSPEMFDGKEDLLIRGKDVFTQSELWFGVGDSVAGRHEKAV